MTNYPMSRRVGGLRSVIRSVVMLLSRGTLVARAGLRLMLVQSLVVSCLVVTWIEHPERLSLHLILLAGWHIVRMLVYG